MPATLVHLVRHGESTWNREGRLQGQTIHPALTDRGLGQAAAAAETLAGLLEGRSAVLWSSDLVRAAQTAAVIGTRLGVPVRHDEALREQSLGRLEGKLTRDLRPEPTPPGQHVGDIRWGGGESTADVHARVGRFLTRELSVAAGAGLARDQDAEALVAADDTGTGAAGLGDGIRHLIVVSHGDAIRVAHAWLLGRSHRELDWFPLPNGSVTSVHPDHCV